MRNPVHLTILLAGVISLSSLSADGQSTAPAAHFSERLSSVADTEIRASLQSNGVLPLAETNPYLPPAKIKKLEAIFRQLLIAKDGPGPFHLVISDDMNVGASFFSRPASTEKVVVVNLGLLEFAQSDDELVAVLGHELEHGTSVIQKEVDAVKRTILHPKALDVAYAVGLQKTVESEMDVKSVLNRVMPHGYNVEAMAQFHKRLIDRFGDNFSDTHNRSGSRKNHLEAATSIMSRKAGLEMNRSTFRNEIVNEDFQRALRDPGIKAERMKRARQKFGTVDPELTKVVEDIAKQTNGTYPEFTISSAITKSLNRRREEILSAVSEIATPEEILDLELEATAETIKALKTESKRVLGADPTKTLPPTYANLEALVQIEAPRISGSLHGEFEPALARIQQHRVTLQAKVSALSRSSSHEARSELIGVQKELAELEKQYALLKSAYVTDDPDFFFAKSEALAKRFVELHSRFDDGANTFRLEQIAELKKLAAHLKHIGTFERTRLQLEKQKSQRLLSSLGEYIKTGVGNHYDFDDLAKSYAKENSSVAIRQFAESIVSNLEKALEDTKLSRRPSNTVDRAMMLLLKLERETSWFANNWETDPLPAELVGRAVDATIKSAKKLYQLKPISIRGIGKGDRIAYDGRWDKRTAIEIFNPQRINQYLEKLEAVTLQGLETAKKYGRLNTEGHLTVDAFYRHLTGLKAAGYKGLSTTELKRVAGQFAAFHSDVGFFRNSPKPQSPDELKAARQYAEDLFFVRGLAVTNQPYWDIEAEILSDMRAESEVIFKRLNEPSAQLRSKLDGSFVELEDLVNLARAAGKSETEAFELAIKHERVLARPRSDAVAFETRPVFTSLDVAERFEMRFRFAGYVKDKYPDKMYLGYLEANRYFEKWGTLQPTDVPQRIKEAGKVIFRNRLAELSEQIKAQGRASEKEVRQVLRRAFQELGPTIINTSQVAEVLEWGFRNNWSNSTKVIWLSAAMDEFESAFSKQYPQGSKSHPEMKNRITELMQRNNLWDVRTIDLDSLNVHSQMQLFRLHTRIDGASANTDDLFEEIWKRNTDHPERRKVFLDSELVGQLYFNDTKRRFAKWQLETKYNVSAKAAELKGNPTLQPKVREIRPEVKTVHDWVNKMFPNKSFIKDELLEDVEARLRSSLAEHEMMAPSRQSLSNWHKSGALALSDIPDTVSSQLKSAFDRHQMLEFLIGVREEPPNALIKDSDPIYAERQRKAALAFRREFVAWSQPIRTLTLQPLMNEENGILSDRILVEKVERLLLGDRFSDELVRDIFKSYLESVPSGEKRVILSHLLAGATEQRVTKSASVKTVLEAMGPFGIKAGQFIRSTGLVSPEVAKDLSSFLDQALPPDREQIFKDLQKTFGEDLKILSSVGERAGSGSVNYVVVADLKNPKTGKIERATVRFQRDAVEGIARNESQVWERVIGKMRARGDRRAVSLANLLDESRMHSMRTLQKGGEELDLSIERANYDRAVAAYEKNGIEVARPLEDFQALVPEELQSKVSVYEHIENQAISSIEDPSVASRVHQRILEAEFTALSNGDFDPDGHSGNWLYNPKTDRLVRIDYAMMYKMEESDLKSFKEVLRKLVNPMTNEQSAEGLTPALKSLLTFDGMKPSDAEITAILKRLLTATDFPATNAPHDRLFYIREKLEKALLNKYPSGSLRFTASARTALASLARIAEHAQHVPREVFERQFATLVEATKSRIIQDKILETGANMKAAISGSGADCSSLFAKLRSIFKRPAKGQTP